MGYSLLQISEILLKADKTMYRLGTVAYENMFSEDSEDVDFERDIIYIYKKAVEYADDFYVGTLKLDQVVERLANKLTIYNYGSLNPIYSDVSILNPVIPRGSVLNDLDDVTITNLQDNQILKYNAALGQWVNTGSNAAIRSSQTFTATLNQTVFTTTSQFTAPLLDVYLNGVRLNSSSYSTFGNHTITLVDGCLADDIIDVTIYDPQTDILDMIGYMKTSVYDTDADGIVDNSEKISIIGRNSTGATIHKGKIVYLQGSTGNRPNIVLAQANAEASSSKTFGVVVEDIANNADGEVAAIGTLHDLDTRSNATNPFTTDTLLDGDKIWLSATNPGYVTKTPPTQPNHTVFIGFVARTTPSFGRIIYNIQNGFELDELHNVLITSATNNDILYYDLATGLWKNRAKSGWLGGTSSQFVKGDGTLDSNTYLTTGTAASTYVALGGSYANPSWITALAWSKISGAPSFVSTEVDPIFTAHPAYGITAANICNWDNAYTWVSNFPTQTGNSGKFLTTNGSNLLWANIVSGVSSFNTRIGPITLISNDVTVALGYTPYNATNPAGYITGFDADDISYALGYIPYSSANPAGYITGINYSSVTNALGYIPVPTTRTLTINGTAYDLSADRSWTVSASANTIYTADGTLTGDRTITSGGFSLTINPKTIFNFSGNAGIPETTTPLIATSFAQTFTATYSNVLVYGVDISPTFNTAGGGYLTAAALRIGNSSGYAIYQSNASVISRFDGRIDVGGAATAPVAKVEINAMASSTRGIRITSNDPTNGGIVFTNTNGTNVFALIAGITNQTANGFTFRNLTTNSDLYTIHNNGNIIIGGVTDSGYKLDVNGTARVNSELTVGGAILAYGGYIENGNYPGGIKLEQFDGANTLYSGGRSASKEILMWKSTGILIKQNPGTNLTASSILELSSTTQGFLPPRMTTTQRDAIASPATGLVIYNTTTLAANVYNGTSWVGLGGGGDNIYTADGTLTGNRTVTMGSNTLSFEKDVYINSQRIGKGAGNQTSNFAAGSQTLNANTTGNFNTAVGNTALRDNTTGSLNTAVGVSALLSNTDAFVNTAVGASTFMNLNSGSGNTAVGDDAGRYFTGSASLTTANNSIFIGRRSAALGNNQTNQIVIGNDATGLGSNTTVIGNSSTVTSAIYGRLLLGTTTDSGLYQLDVNGTARVSGNITAPSVISSSSTLNLGISDVTTYQITTELFRSHASSGWLIAQFFGSGITQGSYGVWVDQTNGRLQLGAASRYILNIHSTNDNVSIDSQGVSPTSAASALFQVNSTTKGFLPPRMTSTQRTAISSPAVGLVVYQTDATEGTYEYTSTGWRIINAGGTGGGITRSVNNISTTTTAGAAASTDYVYFISGTTTLTLPTAVGNTNRYTLKNVGTSTVTINTTSSQTIDGSTSLTISVRYTAIDVVSDGTNWNII
jgi:hypothetical protein